MLLLLIEEQESKHSMKPRGYWDPKRNKHMRLYFETFAKNRGLDPLLPGSWYSLSSEASLQKVLHSLLHF